MWAWCVVTDAVADGNVGVVLVPVVLGGVETGTCGRSGGRRGGRLLRSVGW